ncbi:hypothetical protein X798_01725 [Onchocerca flexuosa]|uniref:Uncharacterized protein n=2 Tax=Onchocerca flexuosa TaxID=387005 RepID=A0A183HYA3_9BILA|nr:hypothetical protein X798_01725 [Onchocerca flexuosa]VDP11387.1 unnamed protein product [Onchocerca flexuosa]
MSVLMDFEWVDGSIGEEISIHGQNHEERASESCKKWSNSVGHTQKPMGPSVVESLEETMTLICPHRIVLSEHMWRMAVLEIWIFLPAKSQQF